MPSDITNANLVGTWDYVITWKDKTIPTSHYQLQILQQDSELIGKYIVPPPTENLSDFEIRLYYDNVSKRGRPVITIAQIAKGIPNDAYRAVLIGRMDEDTLIKGRFVDIDYNQGTFTLKKK
jgi:hypothetical protein